MSKVVNEEMFLFFLDRYLGMGLLGQMVRIYLAFQEPAKLFSEVTLLVILHPHQHCRRVPVPPHPCWHLALSVFWIIIIPVSVKWHFVVLICISLINLIDDVEDLFLCLFPVHTSLW